MMGMFGGVASLLECRLWRGRGKRFAGASGGTRGPGDGDHERNENDEGFPAGETQGGEDLTAVKEAHSQPENDKGQLGGVPDFPETGEKNDGKAHRPQDPETNQLS